MIFVFNASPQQMQWSTHRHDPTRFARSLQAALHLNGNKYSAQSASEEKQRIKLLPATAPISCTTNQVSSEISLVRNQEASLFGKGGRC
jgi:hypothetical protein